MEHETKAPVQSPPTYSFFRGRNEAVTATLDQVSEPASTHQACSQQHPRPSEGNGLEDGSLQLQISSSPDQTPGLTGQGQSWGSS